MKLKPAYIIAAFLALLCLAFCHESRAEVSIEAGAVFMSGDYAQGGTLILAERFGRYEVHIGYVSETFVQTCGRPDCAFDNRENIFVGAQRIVGWDRFKLGIGTAYWQNTNRALGAEFTFSLLVEYRLSDSLTLRVRHASNAGSATPNLGVDSLTLAYGFGE